MMPAVERLEAAFNLRQYALRAIISPRYAAAPSWAELVTLTEPGRAYVELEPEVKQCCPLGDVH